MSRIGQAPNGSLQWKGILLDKNAHRLKASPEIVCSSGRAGMFRTAGSIIAVQLGCKVMSCFVTCGWL